MAYEGWAWQLDQDGKHSGPYTAPELKALLDAKIVLPRHKVTSESLGGLWLELWVVVGAYNKSKGIETEPVTEAEVTPEVAQESVEPRKTRRPRPVLVLHEVVTKPTQLIFAVAGILGICAGGAWLLKKHAPAKSSDGIAQIRVAPSALPDAGRDPASFLPPKAEQASYPWNPASPGIAAAPVRRADLPPPVVLDPNDFPRLQADPVQEDNTPRATRDLSVSTVAVDPGWQPIFPEIPQERFHPPPLMISPDEIGRGEPPNGGRAPPPVLPVLPDFPGQGGGVSL